MDIQFPTFQLKKKVVVITGGESGLGRWMSFGFANAGADICLVGLNSKKLQTTKEEISRYNPELKVISYTCDVRSAEEIEDTFNLIHQEFKKIDILINNAGVILKKNTLDVTAEEFDNVSSINYRGVFLVGRKAASIMIETGSKGRIINISSAAGISVRPDQFRSVYGSTKAAVIQLTKVWAAEWAVHGINVNALAPGYFETELALNVMKDPSVVASMMLTTPKKRAGKAMDIIGPALFLASDLSEYITGQIIPVDGGRTVI